MKDHPHQSYFAMSTEIGLPSNPPMPLGRQQRDRPLFRFALPRARQISVAALLVVLMAAAFSSPTFAQNGIEEGGEEAPKLGFELGQGSVFVTGVEPNTPVALVGLVRYLKDGFTVNAWTQMVRGGEDFGTYGEDGEPGSVEFRLGHTISSASMLVAVNLLTGDFAVFDGGATRVKEIPFPLDSFRVNSYQTVDGLNVPLRNAYVWLIRPRSGIWYRRGQDGTRQDEDGYLDNRLVVSLATFRPAIDNGELDAVDLGQARGGQPFELDIDDVVLVVNPRTFEFYVAKMEG